ncbi:MAG TPA: peptidylprolyl isomerase [Thermoanaerobaculia bacterium]|nr:peptidylprolyl isomerase [Thermoanaerobaculia bacterium]
MRKLLSLLLLASCIQKPVPAPVPVPAPEAIAIHGLTIDEEASVLALEDRREFNAELVNAWTTHANALHRTRIALALARIGPNTFVDTNGNGERDANEKQAGVDQLLVLANDPDRNVRELSAFALGEIGDGSETLFKLAFDSDGAVGAEAVEALSKLAKNELSRYAPLTARDRAEGPRARAIRFLFRFDSDEASALAASSLDDASSAIRQESTYVLARRAYAPARDRLQLLLGDANTLTRAYAAMALGRIGDRESYAPLVAALGDVHPWVRTNAIIAIARLAAKSPDVVNADDMPRLIAITEDPDPGTRAAALDAIGWYAAKNATAHKKLYDIASNGTRVEREIAAGVIARHFPDDLPAELSNWAKARVLETSTQLGPKGAELRRRFANDDDVLVRMNIVSNIPDDEADAEIALIRRALEDPDVIVRTNAIDKYAATKSEPAETKLATLRAAYERAKADRDADARFAAIHALADIDYPERESFLRSLLTDKEPILRRAAADFIEQNLKKNRPQYTPLAIENPPDYKAIVEWSHTPHTATIHMTRGAIEIALLAQDAPMTAWNFAQLAKQKYFDNTSFMRVVPNFVIQGGDPRNDMNGGPGYAIRDEINLQKYTRGAVGMALSGPDTGGSQFFITHSPQPHLDGGYTIFARVYEGMSGVVDQTERGDRVERIAIDEHAAVAATALAAPQKTPLPTEIGPITAERLLAVVPEYAERKSDYKPDATVVEMIKDNVRAGDRVEIYMGTWCPDSQREVPHFLRINDELKLPMTFVAVDRSKTKPEKLLDGKHIEKVATFIVYRGDEELGRVVEKPASLLEDDLLAIVAPHH